MKTRHHTHLHPRSPSLYLSRWTLEDSIQLSQELKEIGVDMMDVSTGGLDRTQKLPATVPGYQVYIGFRLE